MATPRPWSGAVVELFVTASLMATLYLASEWVGTPFVPYDLFDWEARGLPGDLVTFGIDLMIDSMRLVGMSVANIAETAEQFIALAQFLGAGVVGGGVSFFVLNRWPRIASSMSRWTRESSTLVGLGLGALAGLAMVPISAGMGVSNVNAFVEAFWLLVAFALSGTAVGWAYSRLLTKAATAPAGESTPGQELSRRQFLVRLGAATATITIVGAGAGKALDSAAGRRAEDAMEAAMAAMPASARPAFPNAADPLVPAPGTRSEYTEVRDHYRVFIRVEPTVIDGESWTLPVTGLVDNPLELKLDDLINDYEHHDQYVTLNCISGRLGTELISTTRWTGVSVQGILADLRVQPNAKYLHITSGDGFYETVALDLIASDPRIMLAYAWDGQAIPVDHGFPLRIWLPDRYGMKQPKWITGIEVIEENKDGYWVERGWDAVARVNAVSVVDTIGSEAVYESDCQMFVPVGGIAFAGDRGISKVELSEDGGPWNEAVLKSPLSDTTWVIWRYEWPFKEGKHTLAVRCNERDGTPQVTEFGNRRPSGATGIHSKRT